MWSGFCGLGTLSAAKDEGVWGVGVDTDQSYLGPQILTSAVSRLDEGVFTMIRRFVGGNWPPTGETSSICAMEESSWPDQPRVPRRPSAGWRRSAKRSWRARFACRGLPLRTYELLFLGPDPDGALPDGDRDGMGTDRATRVARSVAGSIRQRKPVLGPTVQSARLPLQIVRIAVVRNGILSGVSVVGSRCQT